MAKTFQQSAHELKDTVARAIAQFEKEHGEMGVSLTYAPAAGLSMTIRPKETLSYTVKAGNTVPLAKSKAATGNAAPVPVE